MRGQALSVVLVSFLIVSPPATWAQQATDRDSAMAIIAEELSELQSEFGRAQVAAVEEEARAREKKQLIQLRVQEDPPEVIEVVESGTAIRADSSDSAQLLRQAELNERFPVISSTEEWYEIDLGEQLNGYRRGWIARDRVEPIMVGDTVKSLEGQLQIRRGAFLDVDDIEQAVKNALRGVLIASVDQEFFEKAVSTLDSLRHRLPVAQRGVSVTSVYLTAGLSPGVTFVFSLPDSLPENQK